MDKKRSYWITIIIAAVVLIVLLLFLLARSHSGSEVPHAGHGNTVNGQSESAGVTEMETKNQPEDAAEPQDSQFESENALTLYLNEQDLIMTGMMEKMEVEPSGNASLDFLRGMIPHHKAAIEMADSYLDYGGKNEALFALAKSIIEAQTDEIDQMNRLIQEIEASGEGDEEKETGYLEAYNKMMAGHGHMNHGGTDVSDVELAFAEGMLMHHQMAVAMAEAILDYTDHEGVRKLAETIIDTQEQEIEQMQAILDGAAAK